MAHATEVAFALFADGGHKSDRAAKPDLRRVQRLYEADQRGQTVSVELANDGKAAALAAKLTLLDRRGERILPAYYSDKPVLVASR